MTTSALRRIMNRKQQTIRGLSWITEDQLLEIDKLCASASQPVAGLIHARNVSRCRQEFLEKMLESWPVIRENLNLRK